MAYLVSKVTAYAVLSSTNAKYIVSKVTAYAVLEPGTDTGVADRQGFVYAQRVRRS